MATQAIFQEQQTALNRAVRSWDRRLRAQQTLVWLPRSLMPGLVLGIVLAVISRLRPFLLPGQLALIGAVGVVVGIVVMLAVVWLWRRPALTAARRFDLMFGLNERVSTALELIDGRIQSNDELASRQVNDAWQRVASVRANDALPFNTSPREWGAAAVMALVLVALILLPNPRADEVAANDAQQAAIDEAAEDLREVTEDIATDPNLDDAEREALLQALDRGIETLEREDVSPEEAFATLSDVQAALQERANLFNQQLNDSSTAMERAAEALSDFQPQEAQEQQEQEQDQSALEQALQQMMQQMGGMNSQQQQAGAQAMQQAADALQNTNPQASQQMQQASQQMQQGQTGQAQQSMQQAQQSVQQQQQAQQGQQQSAQQMQQSANQVGQSAQQVAQSGQQQQQGQQGGQQQQGQQQGGQPQGQPQTGQQQGNQQGQQGGQQQQAGQQGQQGQQGAPQEGQEGGSQEGQEGMQDASGQQQGQQGGQQEESGSGGGAGDGEGDAGSDASGGQAAQPPGQGNNPDGVGESDYAPVFSPRQIGGELGEDEIILEPDGSSAPVVEGEFAQNPDGQSQVPYNQVYDSYVGDVNRALDSDYIPLGLRDVVRDYFSSLEPGQGQD